MAGIGQTTERCFDLLPAPFVLQSAFDQRRDEGAAPARAGAPVELCDEVIVQRYVYMHGLLVAHIVFHLIANPPHGKDRTAQSRTGQRAQTRLPTGVEPVPMLTEFQAGVDGGHHVILG